MGEVWLCGVHWCFCELVFVAGGAEPVVVGFAVDEFVLCGVFFAVVAIVLCCFWWFVLFHIVPSFYFFVSV